MAMYFSSGEGRCPSVTKTTEVRTLSRQECKDLRDDLAAAEGNDAKRVALLAGYFGNFLVDVLEVLDFIITQYLGVELLKEYYTDNVRDLTNAIENMDGTSSKDIYFRIRCTNKGQNGHVWWLEKVFIS